MTILARSEEFKSELCRVSFAQDLFKAKPKDSKDPNSRLTFGCTLIFPKVPATARLAMEKIIAGVCEEAWPGKSVAMIKAGLIKSPFLDGASKSAHNQSTGELHPGMGPDVFFIRTQSQKQPPCFHGWPAVPATNENVYSGCYGKAVLNVFAWHDDRQGNGLSFGISMFQKLQEGEKIGGSGGVDADKWLETIADEGAAPESTKGGAGAGGLFGA